MSRPAPALRRLAVGALATVTLGAVLPTLLATSASAAPATRLVASPSAASAGTCSQVTVTPVDDGGLSANAATVTVRIDEGDAASDTQDVDFCLLANDSSPSARAAYTSSPSVLPPSTGPTVQYTPGSTLTQSGEGDVAAGSNDDPTATDRSNPTGVDRRTFANVSGPIRFGVVGLRAGRLDVLAFVDGDADGTQDAADTVSTTTTVTLTDGGLPGSVDAANAVRKLEPAPLTGSAQEGTPQLFTVVATNAQGNTVRGVTPLVQVRPGGANSAPADIIRADCGATDNAGKANCVFQGAKVGTDTLLVYVDQTINAGTAGPQTAEPQASITRTTTLQAVGANLARFVDLTPKAATTTVGTSREYTALVTAQSGAPAQGVDLVFSETGPGRFSSAATPTARTDVDGKAVVTVLTNGETPGRQTLTVGIVRPQDTQCQQTTAPAGRCTDTTTNDLVVPSTPTPTTTPSATPTVSVTPSPTATTAPPTTAPPVVQRPTVSVNPSTIVAVQQKSIVSGTAVPGSIVEIYAYSRPSTTYQRVRTGTAGTDGRYAFEVGPSGNTRLYARTITSQGSADSDSIVLTVRTSLNLKVARTGTRTVRFTGSLLPKRPGQLITVFYENASGQRVIAARARNAADGTYNVSRTFTGSGTFTFFTGTGTDNNNAANNSNRVRAAVR